MNCVNKNCWHGRKLLTQQGVATPLTLPEDDEMQIREKVFDQFRLTDLKDEEGLTKRLEFLDKHLAKDELTDSLEKFEDFDDFTRTEGQSIEEFIEIF